MNKPEAYMILSAELRRELSHVLVVYGLFALLALTRGAYWKKAIKQTSMSMA